MLHGPNEQDNPAMDADDFKAGQRVWLKPTQVEVLRVGSIGYDIEMPTGQIIFLEDDGEETLFDAEAPSLTLGAYQELVKETMETQTRRSAFSRAEVSFDALLSEVNDAIVEHRPIARAFMRKELGSLLYAVVALCEKLGYDAETIMLLNAQKLEEEHHESDTDPTTH